MFEEFCAKGFIDVDCSKLDTVLHRRAMGRFIMDAMVVPQLWRFAWFLGDNFGVDSFL